MSLDVYDALAKMKKLTELSIPFTVEFYSWNSTKSKSQGYKVVDKVLLRQGLRKDNSNKADALIAYYDYNKSREGFFNLPLLMKLNGITINP